MSENTETVENGAATPTTSISVADALLQRCSDATLMTDMREQMEAVDKASTTGGFENAMQVARDINLSVDELKAWMQPTAKSKPDAIGAAVNQIHDACAPTHGPTMRNLVSAALQLAVDAAPEEDAKRAKLDTTKVPHEKCTLVPVTSSREPKKGDNTPAKTLVDAAAYDKLYTLYTEAENKGETELASVYAQACNCAVTDDKIPQEEIDRLGSASNVRIARIRELAALKQAKVVAGGRFKSILFLPHVSGEIEAFQKANPGKSIGSLWCDAVAAARSAHSEYMGKLEKGTAVDVATLITGMRKATSSYLSGKSSTKVVSEKLKSQVISETNTALFANARKLHDLGAVDEGFSDALAKALTSGLFDDGQFMTAIGVIMDCAGLKTEELDRRKKEEEQRVEREQKAEADRLTAQANAIKRQEKKEQAKKDAQAAIDAKAALKTQQDSIDKQAADDAAAAQSEVEEAVSETPQDKVARKRATKAA